MPLSLDMDDDRNYRHERSSFLDTKSVSQLCMSTALYWLLCTSRQIYKKSSISASTLETNLPPPHTTTRPWSSPGIPLSLKLLDALVENGEAEKLWSKQSWESQRVVEWLEK